MARLINGFRLREVSLIDHCIYCGSKDFDKPGVHPITGKMCNHPNKLHKITALATGNDEVELQRGIDQLKEKFNGNKPWLKGK